MCVDPVKENLAVEFRNPLEETFEDDSDGKLSVITTTQNSASKISRVWKPRRYSRESMPRLTLSRDDFLQNEHQAKFYIDHLRNVRLVNIRKICSLAGRMHKSGSAITEELARHREIIHTTTGNLHTTEQSLEDTKEMISLRAELANRVRDNAANLIPDCSYLKKPIRRKRSVSQPIILPSEMVDHSFKGSVRHLIAHMDMLESQQLDIKEDLDRQERELNAVSNELDEVMDEVTDQTKLVHRKIKNVR